MVEVGDIVRLDTPNKSSFGVVIGLGRDGFEVHGICTAGYVWAIWADNMDDALNYYTEYQSSMSVDGAEWAFERDLEVVGRVKNVKVNYLWR